MYNLNLKFADKPKFPSKLEALKTMNSWGSDAGRHLRFFRAISCSRPDSVEPMEANGSEDGFD